MGSTPLRWLIAGLMTVLMGLGGGGASLAAPAQSAAKPMLVKTDPHKITTKRQAARYLKNTPRHFRRFVVAEVKRLDDCDSGTAYLRVRWYHRKSFAAGSFEACSTGAGVVWRRTAKRWRPVVYVQALPTCAKLRKHRVPRNLWNKYQGGTGYCDEDGEYVPYEGP